MPLAYASDIVNWLSRRTMTAILFNWFSISQTEMKKHTQIDGKNESNKDVSSAYTLQTVIAHANDSWVIALDSASRNRRNNTYCCTVDIDNDSWVIIQR